MAQLTRQYLEYVEMMRTHAARARRRVPADGGDADRDQVAPAAAAAAGAPSAIEEDPRAELVRRLLEYERMKKAAQGLDELPQVGRDVIAISVWFEKTRVAAPAGRRMPSDLAEAWRGAAASRAAHRRITS